jgi:RNA polymerase sigma factor (sigma-70 family)
MNGTELLADFREHRSDGAFTELVRRYTNLVYAVASRRVANVALAQEATQLVFIRLAQAAPKLRGDAELVAWLHRTTVHVSIDLWRSEFRRRAREERAAAMQNEVDENTAWNEVAPALDEALNELNEGERQTLLLRFFAHKTMRELGAALGVSEDAAKMRVSRALERLRGQLSARGVTCGAVMLGTMLTDRAVEAAPGSVVATLMCLSWPVPAGVTGGAGFFSGLGLISRAKLAGGLAAAVLIGGIALLSFRAREKSNPPAPAENSPAAASRVAAIQSSNRPARPEAATVTEAGEPNPLQLLQAVARARLRINSGLVEIRVATESLQNGQRETNQLRLSALFDGPNLRWEQVGREYRYTAVGEGSAAQEERMKKEGLDRAAAVRAGLLQGFEARYVTAYDGAALLKYRETDGKSADAVIDDPNKGSVEFIFDPRCLGLGTFLTVGSTVENCLGHIDAKSVQLLGKELVEGVAAWHVQVKSRHDATLDFWMDVARPTCVLKHASGRAVVVSKYENQTTRNPLPSETTTIESRNGTLYYSQRFVQVSAQFDVPVDPASWTLAGLGMKVGSAVVDVRNHRIIGYWNGADLSELPQRTGTPAPSPPNLLELLALLENDPASSSALDAAVWILRNTPDGPAVEKAAEVILREHTRNPNLTQLARELERVRPRCATNLLEALLNDNPSAEVRATACFHLATLLKEDGKFGLNRQATAKAEKLFARVTTEFAGAGRTGADLARRAKPQLHDLRHLLIGMPAPETAGEDLEGQPMNLNDYRGQVVVLFFWTASVASEVADLRRRADRASGRPVAYVGVNCDDHLNKAKQAVGKYEIPWTSFRDRQHGPISANWNVDGWLTIIVLDAQGAIRHRDLRWHEVDQAVDKLLREGTPPQLGRGLMP